MLIFDISRFLTLKINHEFKAAYEHLAHLSQDSEDSRMEALKLKQILDNYLHQLPVVGFNSGKYDICVIKPYLVKRLLVKEQSEDSDATVTMSEMGRREAVQKSTKDSVTVVDSDDVDLFDEALGVSDEDKRRSEGE